LAGLILPGDFEFRCYGFLCELLAAPGKVQDGEQTLIRCFIIGGCRERPGLEDYWHSGYYQSTSG